MKLFLMLAGALVALAAPPDGLAAEGVVAILTRTSPTTLRLCSGVIIRPTLVLTAAHCVPRNEAELRATLVTNLASVAFVGAARDMGAVWSKLAASPAETSPASGAWAYGSPDAVSEGRYVWAAIGRDVGAIGLEHALTDARPAELESLALGPADSVDAVYVGYSSFERQSTQLKIRASQEYSYFFSSSPALKTGDSGGPIFVSRGGKTLAVGVASVRDRFGGSDFARMTPDLLRWLNGL